jgi:hypothetical protein
MVKEDPRDGNSNCRWHGKRGRETHSRIHINPGKTNWRFRENKLSQHIDEPLQWLAGQYEIKQLAAAPSSGRTLVL